MASDEDKVPQKYQYKWASNSELPLPDFLTKYKPSMVQNDGTKPWIWVQGSEPSSEDQGEAEAITQAAALLKEVTQEVENIKNDASIPVRSNKKTGAKSKKEVRELKQAEATEKLKGISQRHGYISGKWLMFAAPDKVDMIWSKVATSLVSGPLAATSAFLTKVSTSPMDDSSTYQHVLCLYMPDVYDKDAVTEVMKILLRNHGLNLSGVKSNLYTSLGLDSKHASGIQSTIWKNTALMKDTEIKELKDAYYAEASAKPDTVLPPPPSDKAASSKDEAAAAPSKPKPKPKLKKKQNNDPFASDDDNDGPEEDKRKQEINSKKATLKSKRPKADDSDDEDEEERPKKKGIQKK